MRKAKILAAALVALAIAAFGLAGCGGSGSSDENISDQLVYTESMEVEYATGFTVDYYEDGYKLISIEDEGRFLVVPEGKEAPEDLAADVVVIYQPLDNIYLLCTSAMDMFRAVDGVGNVTMTGTDVDGWYIPEAVDALQNGSVVYAGKYSMPDYELILSKGCDLAVESTMIYHTPDVKEALESYGIPVLVDQCAYEAEPLGRCEWVKVYGALLNREAEAEAAFAEQRDLYEGVVEGAQNLSDATNVAFFFINSNGGVNIRYGNDYVPKMIEVAGGTYVFSDMVNEESNSSSTTLQMEAFYAQAKSADVLIYNSTIAGEVENLDDLKAKSELLGNFDAVQSGHVWCTTQSMHQESMNIGAFASDIFKIVSNPDVDDSELMYLYRLK